MCGFIGATSQKQELQIVKRHDRISLNKLSCGKFWSITKLLTWLCFNHTHLTPTSLVMPTVYHDCTCFKPRCKITSRILRCVMLIEVIKASSVSDNC